MVAESLLCKKSAERGLRRVGQVRYMNERYDKKVNITSNSGLNECERQRLTKDEEDEKDHNGKKHRPELKKRIKPRERRWLERPETRHDGETAECEAHEEEGARGLSADLDGRGRGLSEVFSRVRRRCR